MAKEIANYKLLNEQDLTDINSKGFVYKHEKTGARIAVISNQDDNKVFSIAFRTTPTDDTGVAHIIEHTVLCGSSKYPVKDPFMELVKGSLNTFMNAMTYPDKTIYPVASCNDQDFKNLMDVYMDAVLNPNIYDKKEFFLQEGVRYTLESPEDELGINGIVYSEMKGAFSSPDELLSTNILRSLYKDTTYFHESGGDPESIPNLTYEQFLDFHRKYYHPSNSFIYLYGDMDVEERLTWLDKEYLSKYDYKYIDSSIENQKEFGKVINEAYEYSIGENEETENKTYLSSNYVIGDSTDLSLRISFDVINRALFNKQGAPVKQALIDLGICEDVQASFWDAIKQPFLSIVARNSNISNKEIFIETINDLLLKEVKKGIDKQALRAAISAMEFNYREADYGRYPKGLFYGIEMLSTWLYDDDKVFDTVKKLAVFDKLKANIETDYFEKLVEEYLLNSKFNAIVTMEPKPGLAARNEAALKQKLADYKSKLSKEEIDAIILQTKNLKAFQETPDTKEALATIPKLSIKDIKKEVAPNSNIERKIGKVPALLHDFETNGISYISLLFRLGDIKKELIPYVGILQRVLGCVNTGDLSYQELSDEISIKTGGIGAESSAFANINKQEAYSTYFGLTTKVLYSQTKDALELITNIITKSDLCDKKRLREIINETKVAYQAAMTQSGDGVALKKALSYISQQAKYFDLSNGYSFYRFVDDLSNNFDEKSDELVSRLNELVDYIFRKDNLFVSITAKEEGFSKLSENIDILYSKLSEDAGSNNDYPVFNLSNSQEGLFIPGQVQYVAKCANFRKAGFEYSGSLKVLKTILGLDYLWNQIRVKNGAYGCSCNFTTIEGIMYFSSYRDPNLTETLEVFDKAYEYVSEFEADDEELTKFIIGTIGNMDTPLTPSMKGYKSLQNYMTHVTMQMLQKERDEVLGTTASKIRELASLIKVISQVDTFCVVGNEKKLNENSDIFGEIKALN